jgi:NAD-dependent DNA ligase
VNAIDLEDQVMAHRYLYYVLAEPVLHDAVYDTIERKAREVCPPESPVHGIGSSLPGSYSDEHVLLATQMLHRKEK